MNYFYIYSYKSQRTTGGLTTLLAMAYTTHDLDLAASCSCYLQALINFRSFVNDIQFSIIVMVLIEIGRTIFYIFPKNNSSCDQLIMLATTKMTILTIYEIQKNTYNLRFSTITCTFLYKLSTVCTFKC